eukprot:5351702-Amphidinium_carterae.1
MSRTWLNGSQTIQHHPVHDQRPLPPEGMRHFEHMSAIYYTVVGRHRKIPESEIWDKVSVRGFHMGLFDKGFATKTEQNDRKVAPSSYVTETQVPSVHA